jgi:dTDP-4-amino-4,6-dideoxygalactose transaminase
LGINGKISELQAAMGLAVLPYMSKILESRKEVVGYYNANLDFSRSRKLEIRNLTNWNFSYYPVVFESETKLLDVQKKLNQNNIFPRRYFYPSLNTLSYVKHKNMKVSDRVSASILCLPLYDGLSQEDVDRVIHVIND